MNDKIARNILKSQMKKRASEKVKPKHVSQSASYSIQNTYDNMVNQALKGFLSHKNRFFKKVVSLFIEFHMLGYLNVAEMNFARLSKDEKVKLYKRIMNYDHNQKLLCQEVQAIIANHNAYQKGRYDNLLALLQERALTSDKFLYKNLLKLRETPEVQAYLGEIKAKLESKPKLLPKVNITKNDYMPLVPDRDEVQYISIGHLKFRTD